MNWCFISESLWLIGFYNTYCQVCSFYFRPESNCRLQFLILSSLAMFFLSSGYVYRVYSRRKNCRRPITKFQSQLKESSYSFSINIDICINIGTRWVLIFILDDRRTRWFSTVQQCLALIGRGIQYRWLSFACPIQRIPAHVPVMISYLMLLGGIHPVPYDARRVLGLTHKGYPGIPQVH